MQSLPETCWNSPCEGREGNESEKERSSGCIRPLRETKDHRG